MSIFVLEKLPTATIHQAIEFFHIHMSVEYSQQEDLKICIHFLCVVLPNEKRGEVFNRGDIIHEEEAF
jgi:hypothetical protein